MSSAWRALAPSGVIGWASASRECTRPPRRRGSSSGTRFWIVAAALAAIVAATCSSVARAATSAPPRNDCSDPYWTYTLRCQVFPNQRPQLNFGVGPTSPGELKDFTRVFLTRRPSVRSIDGTLPVIYVDKAVCTNPAGCGGSAYGDPIESNQWVISMTGGGSCHVHDSDGDLIYDDASECAELYLDPLERDEMGTAFRAPMINLFGINKPDPALNPVFAGYNRVRVQKSSYDRYTGRVAYQAPGGFFTYDSGSGIAHFNLYQQGFLFMEQALRALRAGLVFTTWVADGVGGVTASTETLPALRDATTVLFVGHSGGAHGLYHNVDYLADVLAGMTDPDADVRALFDANFLESIENEAAFATGLNGDAYTDQWSGATVGDDEPFSYDGEVYYTTGDKSEEFDSLGILPDGSCLATHLATDGETWKCRDRMHVLFNHISTPFFFREDFTDPNKEHTAEGAGHNVLWGEWGSYAYCPGSEPCPPRFNLTEHRDRLMEQVQTLVDDSSTRSELATGTDPSLTGVGSFPTFYAWMPECHTHSGAFDDTSFYDTTISYLGTTSTMREWLELFMSAGRTDLRDWRIDGWVDDLGNEMTTDGPVCPLP